MYNSHRRLFFGSFEQRFNLIAQLRISITTKCQQRRALLLRNSRQLMKDVLQKMPTRDGGLVWQANSLRIDNVKLGQTGSRFLGRVALARFDPLKKPAADKFQVAIRS